MSNLPPGCVVRYRICTEKSVPGFGKYADLTFGDIMKVDDEYIPWVYYNIEKVSFREGILDAYGLERIEKPGVDPEKFYAWRRKLSEAFTDEQRRNGRFARARGRKKAAIAAKMQAERETRFTKGELMAINHGHGLRTKKY